MSNPFQDQASFMRACDQTVGVENRDQYALYLDLIREEVQELEDSQHPVSDLDALIDILVVTIGAIHSMGADPEGAWNEVMRSNLDKIDPESGTVLKRGDGKVLKPEGWTAPCLDPYLNEVHR
jgi:predicted HAD superfamily Cof-like phosphohydrolase